MKKKVIVYGPFQLWDKQTITAALMTTALRVRGADVRYVTCDGVFERCHIFTDPALQGQEKKNICNLCQQSGKHIQGTFRVPSETLGQIVSAEEIAQAREWAYALPIDGLETASYRGYPLFEWIRSNVNTAFRNKDIDLDNPVAQETIRGNLYSALITCMLAEKLLVGTGIHAVFMFGGRYASHRPFFEIARRNGIDTYTYDLGPLKGQLIFFKNHLLFDDWKDCKRIYESWKDIPLIREEAEMAADAMSDRRNGHKKHQWINFTGGFHVKEHDAILAKLNFPGKGKLVTYFTSSEDEMYHLLGDEFMTQESIIRTLIRFVNSHEGYHLAIRMHPNLMSWLGGASYDPLAKAFRAYAALAGPKVAYFLPTDPVSSYALVDLTSIVVTTVSTLTMEAAIQGKAVIACSKVGVYGIELAPHGIRCVNNLEDLYRSLEEYPDSRDVREQLRHMHRYVYAKYYHSRFDFPLFQDENSSMDLNNEVLKGMLPGNGGVVDLLSRCILEGGSTHFLPGDADRRKETGEEDEFLPPKYDAYTASEEAARAAWERHRPGAGLAMEVFVWGGGDAAELQLTLESIARSRHLPSKVRIIADGFAEAVLEPYRASYECVTARQAGDLGTREGGFLHFPRSGDEINEFLYFEAAHFLETNLDADAALFREIGKDGFHGFISTNSLDDKPSESSEWGRFSATVFRSRIGTSWVREIPVDGAEAVFSRLRQNHSFHDVKSVGVFSVVREKPAPLKAAEYSEVREKVESICGEADPASCRWLFETARKLPAQSTILQLGALNGRASSALAYGCVGTGSRVLAWDPAFATRNGAHPASSERWTRNLRKNGLHTQAGLLSGPFEDVIAKLPSGIRLLVLGEGFQSRVESAAALTMVSACLSGDAMMCVLSPAGGMGGLQAWAAMPVPRDTSPAIAKAVPPERSWLPSGGESASSAWIRELKADAAAAEWAETFERTIRNGEAGNSALGPAMIMAENRIRRMPEAIRDRMRTWIREMGADGYLCFWNALVLEREERFAAASEEMEAAGRNAHPVAAVWLDRHSDRLKALAGALSTSQVRDLPR